MKHGLDPFLLGIAIGFALYVATLWCRVRRARRDAGDSIQRLRREYRAAMRRERETIEQRGGQR